MVQHIGPLWLNFYGDPHIPKYRKGFWGWLGSSMPNYRRAIKNRGDTAFLGRVLVYLRAKLTPKPQIMTRLLPGMEIAHQRDYILRVDLYAGSEIPIRFDLLLK